ncbi:MAG: gephyrin-like molybdotransferase Glp [Elainellaceae cyanobacterium]
MNGSSLLHPNDAEEIILQCVQPFTNENATDTEWVSLDRCCGRILATDIVSQLDFPHWDNSAMDGYAVRVADVQHCSAAQPVTLKVVEEIPAGYQPQKEVEPGQAARILTGAVLPLGADTIVMQEETQREGDRVTILAAPQPQAFVRHRAAFYKSGQTLLPAGTVISAAEVAVLAAAQCIQVEVFRQPRVAILSTGSELVAPDQPLQPGQIVDSNQYALAALVESVGAIPIRCGIVEDTPEALKQAIASAILNADMILSSGGVSVGDYDYVDQILDELGAVIHVRSVAVKPGKPLTVATLARSAASHVHPVPSELEQATPSESHDILYFGLPGNPVSAMVSFWRFAQVALQKLSGAPGPWQPQWLEGRSRHLLKAGGQRETYLWGTVQAVDGTYEFSLAEGGHSSGNLINLTRTNALAVVPIGATQIAAGEQVQLLRIDRA